MTSNNIFKSIGSRANQMIGPISNLSKAAIDNLGKVVELEYSTAKYLNDICINQLKAAAEIDNVESARSFASKSLELTGQVSKKLVEDSQKYFNLSNEFRGDIENIFSSAAKQTTEPSQKNVAEEEQKAKKATADK